MKNKLIALLLIFAMTEVMTWTAVAQTTIFTGTAGAYNNDTWNQLSGGLPQYWNNGIPSGAGPWEVVISTNSKVYATAGYLGAGETATPAYTGNLTLQANAYLEIAQSSTDADLYTLGTGTITFNLGSRLVFRRDANTVHNQNVVLSGDARIDLCASTSAHVRSRTFNGVISGNGNLYVFGESRNTLILTASNPSWSGGLQATNTYTTTQGSMVTGGGSNCFGTGHVVINDCVSLKINVANTISDSATLYLNGLPGTDAGTATKKLVLNANDTVNMLVKDGTTFPAGNYTSSRSWIQGSGTLTVLTPSDTTPPLLSSFTDDVSGGPIPEATVLINYTATFNDAMDDLTIGTTDFGNAGTAMVIIGAVTQLSATNFNVAVFVESAGTIQLKINAGADIKDMAGNTLNTSSAILDDTIITVTPLIPESNKPRLLPTLDGVVSNNATSNPLVLTLDASGSDKLVVVVTGENGNPGNSSGNCTGITYDGVSLTRAVDRNPILPGPIVTYLDQVFNEIWYLDNPGLVHTGGVIVTSVNSRGVVTAFALSNTEPGVGATGISPQMCKYVKLGVISQKSIVIASHGMGGDGNTANVGSVSTIEPLIKKTAITQGSSYDGHVTGYMLLTSPGVARPTFTNGYLIGSHTIAAEFPGKLLPAGTIINLK
jgi:hypothetical protein